MADGADESGDGAVSNKSFGQAFMAAKDVAEGLMIGGTMALNVANTDLAAKLQPDFLDTHAQAVQTAEDWYPLKHGRDAEEAADRVERDTRPEYTTSLVPGDADVEAAANDEVADTGPADDLVVMDAEIGEPDAINDADAPDGPEAGPDGGVF